LPPQLCELRTTLQLCVVAQAESARAAGERMRINARRQLQIKMRGASPPLARGSCIGGRILLGLCHMRVTTNNAVVVSGLAFVAACAPC
jgi:hypothetical protein